MSDGTRDAFYQSRRDLECSAKDDCECKLCYIPRTRTELNEGVRIVTSETPALKFDDNKVPVELLPTQALEEIAKVLAFGKKKYAAWNWAKGFKWTRLIGAAMRHLFAYARGEDKDPESGLSHIAHAGCCILFLLQHDISKLGEDDRYKDFIKGDNNGI